MPAEQLKLKFYENMMCLNQLIKVRVTYINDNGKLKSILMKSFM